MGYQHLTYFHTPKQELKITPIYCNEVLLEELRRRSMGGVSLPDAETYYPTPIIFPKPDPSRPYLISSIVLSADGKMAYADNREGPLIAQCNYLDPAGAAGDFWCLNVLRANSDGILIGANTLRNEPSNINHCMDQDLFVQRREVLNKKDQPCQVVVSLDASDIPFDHITFRVDPAERLKMIIATSPEGWDYIRKNSPLRHFPVGPFNGIEQIELSKLPAGDDEFDLVPVIITGEGNQPDLKLLLRVLRRMGMETVCVESPTCCAALMAEECLDEYFINYSMVYAGGAFSPGAAIPASFRSHPHADLVSVGIHRQNFLFTRQLLRYGVELME